MSGVWDHSEVVTCVPSQVRSWQEYCCSHSAYMHDQKWLDMEAVPTFSSKAM